MPEPTTPGLVSAIIIFLDGEKFIAESIESVLAQTWPDIELLLVDDGSRDGSPAIARRYASLHPGRVRVLEHPGRANRGMSASRNLGVLHSRGQYIAFIDADDVWLPQKTAEQVAILRAHPSLGMVYGRTQIWHSWAEGSKPSTDFFYPLGVETDMVHAAPQLFGNLIDNRFQTPTTCNAMITRKAFDEVGGFEDPFRGMYEDQVFFAKLYLTHHTFVSSQYWARYRQHAGNSHGRFSQSGYFRERLPFLDFIYRHARGRWQALDEKARAVIRRERWKARYPVLATFAGRLPDGAYASRVAMAREAGPAWRRSERKLVAGGLSDRAGGSAASP